VQRRLAAILAADVVGYSKLMAEDESRTLAALRAHRENLFDPETVKRGGRIVKLMGDGTLVEFPSVVDAVECALAIQQALAEDDGPIRLRIGINLGDIIIDGDDIYGDGVNIAARLEALAEPGGICISSIVHESLGNRVEVEFADGGEQEIKNIDQPIKVYGWPTGFSSAPARSVSCRAKARKRLIFGICPFRVLLGDDETEQLAQALTDAMVGTLGSFSVLDVRPVSKSAGQTMEGVGYVLEGSLQKAGQSIRVSCRLSCAETHEQVWTDRFDRQLTNLFEFQDFTGQLIAGRLHQPLMKHAISRASSLPAGQMQAIDYYLCAFHHIERPSAQGLVQAEQAARRALALNPDFALVYELLAWTKIHTSLNAWGGPPKDVLAEGRNLAVKGISLDENEAYLRSAHGLLLVMLGEHKMGLGEAHKAIELNPNDGEHYTFLGLALTYAGRVTEALDAFHTVHSLSPSYPPALLFGAEAHFAAGNLTQATKDLEQFVLALPDYAWGWLNLAASAHQLGDTARSSQALARTIELSPNITRSYVTDLTSHRAPVLHSTFVQSLEQAGLPE
jgi:class 3 adenylate cyclase/TolB-like protein